MKPHGVLLLAKALTLAAACAWSQTPVFVTEGSHPSVSPDGSRLAFSIPSYGIGMIPTAGGQVDTLTAAGTEVDWAPSGDLVVVRDGSDLHTVDLGTMSATLLRSGGFDDGPAWAPFGEEIVLQGSSGLVFVAYPSGALSQMASCLDPVDFQCDGEGPTWSPNSEWIAFEDGLEILKVRRSGGEAILLAGGGADVATADWSPDGEWIAFAMNDNSTHFTNIWVMSADGFASGHARITSSMRDDLRPSWSSDSRTIYFESTRIPDPGTSEVPEIWRVDFDPGQVVSVATQTWSNVKTLYREE